MAFIGGWGPAGGRGTGGMASSDIEARDQQPGMAWLTHYDVLEVEIAADIEIISRSYKKLMLMVCYLFLGPLT